MQYVIYATNLPQTPKDLDDVNKIARQSNKLRISEVHGPKLASAKEGDKIITQKGATLYIIKSAYDDNNVENRDLYDSLVANYDAKESQIGNIKSIVSYSQWSNKTTKTIMETKKDISNLSISERIQQLYTPRREESVCVSVNGEICIKTDEGYVAINNNNELVSYPKEFTFSIPVFSITIQKAQLKVGNIAVIGSSFIKVTEITDKTIKGIGYTGNARTRHDINDALFNQKMIRIIMPLTGLCGGQLNPMMLMLLTKGNDCCSKDNDALAALMLMQQQGANIGVNNNLLQFMLLGGEKNGFDFKTLAMMSMMNGGNIFGVPTAPQAPAPATPQKNEEIGNIPETNEEIDNIPETNEEIGNIPEATE